MRSLYLRIWLTVVVTLALFAAVSGWLVQRHFEGERRRTESELNERLAAWGELMHRSLPGDEAPAADQAAALADWSRRLRIPLALDDRDGRRIAASESFLRRTEDAQGPSDVRTMAIVLPDGRRLWMVRPSFMRRPRGDGDAGGPPQRRRPNIGAPAPWLDWPGVPDGLVLVVLLGLLLAAVAAGAWPVVRRLTRRLEALKVGVEAFGQGALSLRVAEDGRDEVAALARSFNRSAARIESLVQSHKSLLANASHELRSPLARLRMAIALLDDASPDRRAELRREIAINIGELDLLIEEVLLASRLEGDGQALTVETVDLLAVLAEEGGRVGAQVEGDALTVPGDERLLRRALRNLLENARRYGGGEVCGRVAGDASTARVEVCDRGPGVPDALRQRIFEPFFRLPGHAEREGGVGLGLALVRQIAARHGGQVQCLAREGGGSCFVLTLPRT